MKHSSGSLKAIDDPSIALRLEMYRLSTPVERCEIRQALLNEFPELADDLNACCDGLDILADWPREWS